MIDPCQKHLASATKAENSIVLSYKLRTTIPVILYLMKTTDSRGTRIVVSFLLRTRAKTEVMACNHRTAINHLFYKPSSSSNQIINTI